VHGDGLERRVPAATLAARLSVNLYHLPRDNTGRLTDWDIKFGTYDAFRPGIDLSSKGQR